LQEKFIYITVNHVVQIEIIQIIEKMNLIENLKKNHFRKYDICNNLKFWFSTTHKKK